MSSVPTKFNIQRRFTQQGTKDRIVVSRMLEYTDRFEISQYPDPIFTLDPKEFPEVLRAMQSFAMQNGKEVVD